MIFALRWIGLTLVNRASVSSFRGEFYASVAAVRGRPYSFSVDHTGLRPLRLRRFTAVLYYKIEESLIPETPLIVILGLLVGGRDEQCLRYRGYRRRSGEALVLSAAVLVLVIVIGISPDD
jgi:hypothetical protein